MTTQTTFTGGDDAVTTELASGQEVEIAGMLFDMDGTLVDSIESVEDAWRLLAAEYDIPELPPGLHGMTAASVIIELGLPAEEREAAEQRLTAIESRDGQHLQSLPGTSDLLTALPEHRWGIVTSAAESVAHARIKSSQLPQPPFLITSLDVSRTKPDPEPFFKGISELRSRAWEGPVIALEDTVAGLISARDAGCIAIGVLGTMSRSELAEHAHLVIPTVRALTVREEGGRLLLAISDLEGDA